MYHTIAVNNQLIKIALDNPINRFRTYMIDMSVVQTFNKCEMYIIKVTMQKNAVSLQMGVMMSFIILINSFLRAILFILDIVNESLSP